MSFLWPSTSFALCLKKGLMVACFHCSPEQLRLEIEETALAGFLGESFRFHLMRFHSPQKHSSAPP